MTMARLFGPTRRLYVSGPTATGPDDFLLDRQRAIFPPFLFRYDLRPYRWIREEAERAGWKPVLPLADPDLVAADEKRFAEHVRGEIKECDCAVLISVLGDPASAAEAGMLLALGKPLLVLSFEDEPIPRLITGLAHSVGRGAATDEEKTRMLVRQLLGDERAIGQE